MYSKRLQTYNVNMYKLIKPAQYLARLVIVNYHSNFISGLFLVQGAVSYKELKTDLFFMKLV